MKIKIIKSGIDNPGEWIRKEKKDRGFSWAKMAYLLDVDIWTLQNMAAGHIPSTITFDKVVRGLGYELCIVKKCE